VFIHNRFYSAIKKNKIIPFAGKWMEVEISMLSETSHIEKDIASFLLYVESCGEVCMKGKKGG
jgi:hypothetical protein